MTFRVDHLGSESFMLGRTRPSADRFRQGFFSASSSIILGGVFLLHRHQECIVNALAEQGVKRPTFCFGTGIKFVQQQ